MAQVKITGSNFEGAKYVESNAVTWDELKRDIKNQVSGDILSGMMATILVAEGSYTTEEKNTLPVGADVIRISLSPTKNKSGE